LKQSLEHKRKELNDCRAEITALKMHIEGSHWGRNLIAGDVDHVQSQPLEKYKEEIISLQMEIESLKAKNISSDSVNSIDSEKESAQTEEKVVEILEDKSIISHPGDASSGVVDNKVAQLQATQILDDNMDKSEEVSQEFLMSPSDDNDDLENIENVSKQNGEPLSEESRLLLKSDNSSGQAVPENTASSFYSSMRALYSLSHMAQPETSAGIWGGFLLYQCHSVILMFLMGPSI
jgi:hypothetical protein